MQQLLVAGNETTTKMLTEMVRLLAEHPDEWRRVQDDPARVDRSSRRRSACRPRPRGCSASPPAITLGGVDIPAGARIVVAYCSANRDERLFSDPDQFAPEVVPVTPCSARSSTGSPYRFALSARACIHGSSICTMSAPAANRSLISWLTGGGVVHRQRDLVACEIVLRLLRPW